MSTALAHPVEPEALHYEFFASCAKGAERVLAAELVALGAKRVRPLQAGVAFFGGLETGYRACLWLRSASRVLLILDRVAAKDAEELYTSTKSLPWEQHLDPARTIAVAARGTNVKLLDTRFTALKVKDAICDRLRDIHGARPSVAKKRPDVAIDLALRGDRATIALDLAGEPLHMRGYRVQSHAITAPLRETLAATMLLIAGWTDPQAASAYASLLDPCCGSGTIAIEAALIAYDHASGLLRDYWGFKGWLKHDEELWQRLLDEADARVEEAQQTSPTIYASDIDPEAVSVAREAARKAGVEQLIEFAVADVADRAELAAAVAPACTRAKTLVVTNPPYGQRLSSTPQLPAIYAALRRIIDPALAEQVGDLCVITTDNDMEVYLGARPAQRYATYNGALEAEILWYPASQEGVSLDADAYGVDPRDIEQFENRLTKMAAHRAKWARRGAISCYRVYDSDLPSFAVAIDLYEGTGPDKGTRWLHIAEYAPPAHIDPSVAMQRLAVVLTVAPRILKVPLSQVFLKTRLRAQGGSQYAEQATAQHAEKPAVEETAATVPLRSPLINEGGLRFELDFTSHLDTGIFLDHRQVRALLRESASGKDTLNLFAYTGTASVYLAAGGAKTVTSVDLSKSYLRIAQRNMERNGFSGPRFVYDHADVLRWVQDHRHAPQKYGLIFCDPPTFSNSTSMGSRTWEVQRDHGELLIALSRMLAPEGMIVFSTNRRDFAPDLELLRRAGVSLKDITASTIPADFERNKRIHQCYLVSRDRSVV